jgi:predicted nucleotide-binding protein (sugar kinase/HSP70/actin superfamily)
VNPELWKAINKKLKEKNGVLTFYSLENAMNVKETMQIQLIYCSKTRSELFVGYMPKHANLVSVIREVGFEMGFIEVTKSKITFVERSPEVCFPFHELEKYTVETAPDIFLMMFNMERK